MIEMKWTQGLTFDEDEPRDLITEDGELIATCYGSDKEDPGGWDACPVALANTQLFAAASDLYEMTDKLLSILVGELALKSDLDGNALREWLRREYPSIQEATDLLAKARGETGAALSQGRVS